MPDVNEVIEPTETEAPAPTAKPDAGEAAPVETEEGQENGEAKAEGETEETPEQVAEKHKSRNQRRLERAKTRATVAETEARMLREELAKERAARLPAKESEAPKREDFADYESYLDARADYRAEQKAASIIEKEREANQGKEKQSQAATEDAKIAEAWVKGENAFKANTKDYEEVTAAFVEDGLDALSPAARRAIVESDVGPAVLYHLGNDSSLADRIAGLSPVRQIAEIGKLEAKFSTPVKKSSTAPEPISPTKANKSSGKDPQKMTIDELTAWRKANGSKYA